MSSKLDQELVTTLLELSEGLASEHAYIESMNALCDRARTLMDSDRCSIFLLSGGACWGSFNSGNPPEIAKIFNRHKVPVTDPMVQEAFEFKKPVLINNAGTDSRMHSATAKTANINAIILAPLLDETTSIGFITAEYNQRQGTFSELDATLLTGVARLATTIVKSEAMASERDLLGNRVAELQRFEPLGRLAGGLAHDFNNLLTIVLGYCDLIEMEASPENKRDYIETIRNTTLRASNLAHQLLTFSKGGTRTPEPLNLGKTISELTPLLTDLLPDSVQLTVVLPPKPAWVFADSGEMTQLLMNLVLNARDAIIGPGKIEISLVTELNRINLQISDSGVGIDESLLDRIFDPFFSTKDARGLGLGLANVKSILESSHGTITVSSAESGSGSIFTIMLPEHEPGIEVSTRPGKGDPTSQLDQPLTLLIVDDQIDVLRVQANWLKREGHNVFSTPDPLVAKAWMEEFGQEIDLLITDMLMPNLGGAELIDIAVRCHISNALVISGFQGSESIDLTRTDINLAYLQKPFRPSQLGAAISTTLKKTRSS